MNAIRPPFAVARCSERVRTHGFPGERRVRNAWPGVFFASGNGLCHRPIGISFSAGCASAAGYPDHARRTDQRQRGRTILLRGTFMDLGITGKVALVSGGSKGM